MRRLALVALATALLIGAPTPLVAKKTLSIKTTVKDFVTTKWTIDCPDGRTIDLTKAALSEAGWLELMDCMNDIEAENGLEISSKTVVKNSVVESDQVDSETIITEAQAAKLCKIHDDNPFLSSAVFRGRPRIQETTRDFATESFVIDLGDGRLIDVTELDLTQQQLQELLNLLDQIAMQNGTHVTSATGTKGGTVEGDRTIGITWLTPEQVEQILQWFAGQNIAIPPEAFVVPIATRATLKLPMGKVKVELEGHMTIWRQPAQPGNDFVPIEIVDMEMTGISPVGVVTVGLDQGQPGDGAIFPPDKRGRFGLDLMFVPRIEIQDLNLMGTTTQPVGVRGRLTNPPKPAVRMNSKGKHALDVQDQVQRKRSGAPSMKLKRFILRFPASALIIPDGF